MKRPRSCFCGCGRKRSKWWDGANVEGYVVARELAHWLRLLSVAGISRRQDAGERSDAEQMMAEGARFYRLAYDEVHGEGRISGEESRALREWLRQAFGARERLEAAWGPVAPEEPLPHAQVVRGWVFEGKLPGEPEN